MTRMGWRIAVVSVAALGAAALAPTGCTDGPGREDDGILVVANAVCDRLLECGCFSPEDAQDCPLVLADPFYVEAGFVYDDACASKWRQWVSTVSCTDPVLPDLAQVCPIYHGATFEGLPCEYGSSFSTDCGPRLVCLGGTCRDPRGLAFGGLDELCDPYAGCDEGLACGELGRCVPVPGPGQPCPDGRCQGGSRCESLADVDGTTSVCVAGAEVGSPCMGHSECASFNCPAGFCAPAAGLGAPCSSTLPCGPELFCNEGRCDDGGASGFCGTVEIVIDG